MSILLSASQLARRVSSGSLAQHNRSVFLFAMRSTIQQSLYRWNVKYQESRATFASYRLVHQRGRSGRHN
ncbi:hypothetical protein WJX84_009799 [Apatococcus fuscideae]|uniref:Secreted protein n=1 Tax=Apatococcus fuscideae TaxID=2026836 RepID=A0AAW1SWY6_9CHLO